MKAAFCALAGAALLVACGGKNDANEANFAAAITQGLAPRGDQCLGLTKWPVDYTEMIERSEKNIPTSSLARMHALESVGLVKSEDTEAEGRNFDGSPNGNKYKVKRFTLTEAAKPFLKQTKFTNYSLTSGKTEGTRDDLCWATRTLDKVVKWEGPRKDGEYQEALVAYTYKLDKQADWASKPAVLSAFSTIKNAIEGAGKKEQTMMLKLTSQGWEAKKIN